MAVQVSYPGVYIDEFTPAAPIQGAGTSTAAFVGVNAKVVPNEPVLLTSWDAFVDTFTDGGTPEDDDYLWYAVRGFFQNGGKVCFVTAVSNSQADSVVLKDEAPTPQDTIRITARARGQLSPPLVVKAEAAHKISATSATPAKLFEPSATIKATNTDMRSVDVTDAVEAASFLAGDRVILGAGATSDVATVAKVFGSTVFFTAELEGTHNSGQLRLLLERFCTGFRAENVAELPPGSIITLSQDGATPLTTIVTRVASERISNALTTYRVTVNDGIEGFTLYRAGKPIFLQSEEFKLTVGNPDQVYEYLSMNPDHPRYYVDVINNDAAGRVFAEPVDPPNHTTWPANRPKAQQPVTLTGGANHDVVAIRSNPLPNYEKAMAALDRIADVNIVSIPDCTVTAVQKTLVDHCASLADRFAILDSIKGAGLSTMETQRASVESDKGFAALYCPWIEVASQKTSKRITVPPSGHVAGICARTDNNRGVHKAPAGTEATISGALGVEQVLSDSDQSVINPKGINVIRVFQHGGVPVVWGARTTTTNTNWQYVNIRRLFIFLEESIQQGIRGSVFEPNNPSLWQKLKRTIGAFLTQQWRDGALFGNKPEEAFYVRIDEVLNPESERALGRLTIEIGIRPSYPAEFIVVKIGIWQGGSTVSES